MIHQLRIYEIFEINKAAFHDRFRDHAWRIMRRYGFRVLAFWESRSNDRTEFIYLLEWDDEAQLEQAWADFLADEEWKEIKQVTVARHGDLVGEVAERRLNPTSYTPGLVGAGPFRTGATSRAGRSQPVDEVGDPPIESHSELVPAGPQDMASACARPTSGQQGS